jgi:hypothetical protein
MKMKKGKISFLILLIFCLFNCKEPKPKNSLENFHWLLGNWNTKKNEGIFTENWAKRKGMLFGNSILRENDLVSFREKIILKYVKDTLNYIVVFERQYDSTYFKATTIKDSLLIFENPKNDFPKVIKYQLITKDKMVATISGDNYPSETFNFSKK